MLRAIQSAVGKAILHRLLRRIEVGGLTLTYASSGRTHFFGDMGSPTQGSMTILDDHLAWEVVTLSELGLGMGYVEHKWESESPYHAILVLLLNEKQMRRVMMKGYRWDLRALRMVAGLQEKIAHNDVIEHCREQIGLTYDTGNDFYEWMLGDSMTYSCAIWPHEDASLEEAQNHKFDVIIDKLDIRPEHRVLDIGCGWGTLCHRIRARTGADVRGIALSRKQISGCRERHPDIDFEYRDYREETGTYDRIVSVGMVEHVGPNQLPRFCEALVDLLAPGGLSLIHWVGPWDNILIDEHKTRHPNWASILMPNAESPTHSQLISAAMGTGHLRLLHTETFGIHYARTGEQWLANLARHREEILERYPEGVLRSHEYAWQLGRAALETGYCLVQMVFERAPYGSSLARSVVDPSRARAGALHGRASRWRRSEPRRVARGASA